MNRRSRDECERAITKLVALVAEMRSAANEEGAHGGWRGGPGDTDDEEAIAAHERCNALQSEALAYLREES